GRWLVAVERYRGTQRGDARGQQVGDPAAIAEPHHADLAGAFGTVRKERHRSQEILASLVLIELAEELARLVLVAGIAAERRQRIGGERNVLLQGDAPGDVLDVRIEAAVLVDHEDAGQPARTFR